MNRCRELIKKDTRHLTPYTQEKINLVKTVSLKDKVETSRCSRRTDQAHPLTTTRKEERKKKIRGKKGKKAFYFTRYPFLPNSPKMKIYVS